jgi:hypothetical protein
VRNKRQNDCQVLLVSHHQETYRCINGVLKPLGLSAMWVRDIESARMLARTADVKVVLCDPAYRNASKLFSSSVMQPGSSCISMELPKPDPNGTEFELNVDLASRFVHILKNLMTVNMNPAALLTTNSGFQSSTH